MGMNKPGHTFLHTWTSACPCNQLFCMRARCLRPRNCTVLIADTCSWKLRGFHAGSGFGEPSDRPFGSRSRGDEKYGKKTPASSRHSATVACPTAFRLLAVWWNALDGLSFGPNDHDPGWMVSIASHYWPLSQSHLSVLPSAIPARRGRTMGVTTWLVRA